MYAVTSLQKVTTMSISERLNNKIEMVVWFIEYVIISQRWHSYFCIVPLSAAKAILIFFILQQYSVDNCEVVKLL
jgi:hypothetical protein